MREDIRERQNKDWSLDRLAAQRLLYRQVKSVERCRLGLVLLVAALLLAGLSVAAEGFSQIATVAVVFLWFIDQVSLMPLVGRKKEEAAAIQQEFDCFVLDIPWPDHLGVARPTGDRVGELVRSAQHAGVERKELVDWYRPGDIPMDAVPAQLHCQRLNCHWDGRLRGEWIRCVRLAVLGFVMVGLILGVVVGITLLEVVLGVAAAIRLLAWLCVEQSTQSAARKRMRDLHAYLSRSEAENGPTTACDVRLAQTAIFEHRRICPTVPDWYYHLRRKAHEA